MRDLYFPPRGRREAIRNLVISQRSMTGAYLEGDTCNFVTRADRSFVEDVRTLGSECLTLAEISRIRFRVMYKMVEEHLTAERGQLAA